jgi:hypothetical protein
VDFDLNPRTTGRASVPLEAVYIRDLTVADIALLETERGIKPPIIKKLRDSHHSLARSLAAGMRPAEASMVTGYSLSRISILQADPTFQELLAFYRENTDAIYTDVHERMSTLSMEALEELRERLHDTPEQLSPMSLLEIVKTLSDRTGHGPSSKSTVLSVNVDLAGRLERARARLAKREDEDDGTI